MSFSRIAKILSVLALIAGIAWVQRLNHTGYCYVQDRHLSDEELIDVAVNRVLYYRNGLLLSRPDAGYVVYSSYSDFLAKNQNCCSVYRWRAGDRNTSRFGKGQMLSRTLGHYYVVVRVIYLNNARDEKRRFASADVAVTKCGKTGDIAVSSLTSFSR